MKKNKNIELIKDDEILREEAMCDGPTKILDGIELRPITALSVSWMQRNEIFSDTKDTIWKSAAFAYLHSAPFSAIRHVVNDKSAFMEAVDIWIERNLAHHLQAADLSKAMGEAFSRYMSSASEIIGAKESSLGN